MNIARLKLPVLGDRRGGPQPKGPTRLVDADAEQKADAKALALWRRAVKARDGTTCRCCRHKVVVTLKLQSNRSECHHLHPRANKAVRTDVRNGLTVCQACHDRLTRREITIVGTQEFTLGGRRYINADFPIIVKESP